MKLNDLALLLNELAPIQYSEQWDNPGLLVGDMEKEINKVYVALDATSDVIAAAHEAGADLILCHHPLIFKSIKRVSGDNYVGKRVMEIIRNDMALFAMHTDFDITCMGIEASKRLDLIETKVLEPTLGEELGLGCFGYLKEDLTLAELCERVKSAFDIGSVIAYGDLSSVMVKVAVFPGSGSSAIDTAAIEGCDVLITGDISHHDGIDALEKELCIIDAGHYGIEKIFIPYMKEFLENNTEGISVIEDKAEKTFTIV